MTTSPAPAAPAAALPAPRPVADRPVLGIGLMLGFCALAPLGDAIIKIAGQSVALGPVLLVRFAVQALLLAPLVWWTGRAWRLRGRTFWLALLRAGLHMAGIAGMFMALRYLPLADAIAIAFVMPFIMLLMGHFFLREEIGWRRMAACAVGFIGTLMVIQPSFAEVGLPALWPLFVAFDFAAFMMVTRMIARETDPVGLQAVNGVMACALLVPVVLAAGALGLPELALSPLAAPEVGLLLSAGVLGTGAHLLMTWSLRFAPASTLAPMQYLEIPFATFFGLLFFGDLPDGLAAIGIAVTVASGLYVVLRERATSRAGG